MNNEKRPSCAKSLKTGFCGFCAFVRGRGGKNSPHACVGAAGDTPIHNNKNNNNIYIMRIAGGCVAPEGIL
jgi:hypothetical protein